MTVTSSFTQKTYETLRADVLSCRVRPGEKLIISTISDRLGVSIGAVRESLSRLTSEGLVLSKPQRGFWVAPISPDDLKDLTRVRTNIELQCLERSIIHGGIKWESQLVGINHELSCIPPGTPSNPDLPSEAFARVHANFHLALVAACDSPWLLRLRILLYDQSERYRRLSVPLAGAKRDLVREHGEITEAAIARDVGRATTLLEEHFQRTTDLVLSSHFVGNRSQSSAA